MASSKTDSPTDQERVHKHCLSLAECAWRLIALAHGDDSPVFRGNPLREIVVNGRRHTIPVGAPVSEMPMLFVGAIVPLRNEWKDYANLYHARGGKPEFAVWSDSASLTHGCSNRFGSTWHIVAFLIALDIENIIDKVVPTAKLLIPESGGLQTGQAIYERLPESERQTAAIVTADMMRRVYGAIQREFPQFNLNQLVARLKHEYDDTTAIAQLNADSGTDATKNLGRLMPDNADVRDLCALLAERHKTGKSMNQIAREFTRGDVPKADSLLRQARRYRRLWNSADK